MAAYSDDDEARRIVEGFLKPGRRTPDLPDGLAASDLETDALGFSDDLAILDYLNLPVPAFALREGEPVPVALSILAEDALPALSRPVAGTERSLLLTHYLRRLGPGYLRKLLKHRMRVLGCESVSPDRARQSFTHRATEFLAIRMAAVRDYRRSSESKAERRPVLQMFQRIGGKRIPTPGCNFTVNTDSPGLRVFWSGAYRVSHNYFGHPTWPVISVLQSGTYVFGVDGGAYGRNIQWDLNTVVTLPGVPAVHLNY